MSKLFWVIFQKLCRASCVIFQKLYWVIFQAIFGGLLKTCQSYIGLFFKSYIGLFFKLYWVIFSLTRIWILGLVAHVFPFLWPRLGLQVSPCIFLCHEFGVQVLPSISWDLLGSGWEFKFRLTYFYISLAPILEFKFCLTCPVASKSLGLLVSSQEKKRWTSVMVAGQQPSCWSARSRLSCWAATIDEWLLGSNLLADQQV